MWDEVADSNIPTQGYFVEQLMDDDKWQRVFEALTNPNALEATITKLKTAKTYWFRVFAVDFNGPSLPSETIEVYACGKPRQFAPPTYVVSDRESITI